MFAEYLQKVTSGDDLCEKEMEKAMDAIMSGEVSDTRLAGFLTGLKVKGETAEEITGAARAMRDKALPLNIEDDVIDTCGTGGDSSDTFNISTAVAFVLAGGGMMVAKHGNRSISSQSGSADVLEALGAELELPPARVKECLKEAGIGFLFAPLFHKAMKHASTVRSELGIRTIFNILGPLTNPARAEYQLLGVYCEKLVEPMINTLKQLGLKSAMVVHGAGGMDELSLAGKNIIGFFEEGKEIKFSKIYPEDAGLKRAEAAALKGGGPQENSSIILSILAGRDRSPRRDVILFNAGAALKVAGEAATFAEGVEMAGDIIDSGRALASLEKFVARTRTLSSAEAIS